MSSDKRGAPRVPALPKLRLAHGWREELVARVDPSLSRGGVVAKGRGRFRRSSGRRR